MWIGWRTRTRTKNENDSEGSERLLHGGGRDGAKLQAGPVVFHAHGAGKDLRRFPERQRPGLCAERAVVKAALARDDHVGAGKPHVSFQGS